MSSTTAIQLPQGGSDATAVRQTGYGSGSDPLTANGGAENEPFSDSLQRARSELGQNAADLSNDPSDGNSLPQEFAEPGKLLQLQQDTDQHDASSDIVLQADPGVPLPDEQLELSKQSLMHVLPMPAVSDPPTTEQSPKANMAAGATASRMDAEASRMVAAPTIFQQTTGQRTITVTDTLIDASPLTTQTAQDAGSRTGRTPAVAELLSGDIRSAAVTDGSGQETDGLFRASMQALLQSSASPASAVVSPVSHSASSVAVLQTVLNASPVLSASPESVLTGSSIGLNNSAPASTGAFTGMSPLTANVAVPFGQSEWGTAFSRQVMMLVNQNVQSAEIRLNPANLGPIEIQIEMKEEQISVAFSSRHAAVREAMELAMPRLREMLESNGLGLAESHVSDQTFGQQQEMAHSQYPAANSHASGGAVSGEETEIELPGSGTLAATRTVAMLDVYI